MVVRKDVSSLEGTKFGRKKNIYDNSQTIKHTGLIKGMTVWLLFIIGQVWRPSSLNNKVES